MTGDEALLILFRKLGESKVPYMLVGSHSISFYGLPSLTLGADLVLRIKRERLTELIERLPSVIKARAQNTSETVQADCIDRLEVEGGAFQIELFHLSEDDFDQMRFQNRVELDYSEGVRTFLPRVEDVVVQKLRWAEGGKRQKDFDDVVSVLKVQTAIDFSYVEGWCEKHGSLGLLAEAREVAGV